MSRRRARRAHLWVLTILVGVVVVVGGGWFAARMVVAAAPPLELTDTLSATVLDTATPFDPDGSWTIAPGSEAGYRIGEELNGDRGEVVGRTETVRGDLTVQDGVLTAAEIALDVASLTTDDSARDAYFRRAMDSSTYPEATFRLAEPVRLPDLTLGDARRISLSGTLAMHGAAQPVTLTLHAQRTVDGVEVAGQAAITLADYGLTAPGFPFVTVEPDGSIEVRLNLVR